MAFHQGLFCALLTSLCLAGCGAITHLAIPYEDEVGPQQKHAAVIQSAPAVDQAVQPQPVVTPAAAKIAQPMAKKEVQAHAVAVSPATPAAQVTQDKKAAHPAQAVTVLKVPSHIHQDVRKTRHYYHAENQRSSIQDDHLLIPPNSTFQAKQ